MTDFASEAVRVSDSYVPAGHIDWSAVPGHRTLYSLQNTAVPDEITATGRHMLRDLPHARSPDWGAAYGSIRDETHRRIGAPLARLRDDELVNGAATLALSWPRS